MLKDKGEIFRLSDNLCSMVFSDLQKFVNNLVIDGDLTIIEVAELLDINANDVYKIIHNDLPDVTLKTYLRILVASELTLDVHTLKAPYDHSNDKIKYDNIEKELYEKKNEFLEALKESKPDSKYLQELRELAKTNADNKKLCELIRYYTD